jgi:hypothetical protein
VGDFIPTVTQQIESGQRKALINQALLNQKVYLEIDAALEMNPGIKAVTELVTLGYRFERVGGNLKFTYEGHFSGTEDEFRVLVRPWFALILEHKPAVLEYFSEMEGLT